MLAFASPFIFFTDTIIVCLDRLCTLWAGKLILTSYTLALQLPRVAQPIFLSYTLANRRLKQNLASYTLFTVYHGLQRGYRNSFFALYTLLSRSPTFCEGTTVHFILSYPVSSDRTQNDITEQICYYRIVFLNNDYAY